MSSFFNDNASGLTELPADAIHRCKVLVSGANKSSAVNSVTSITICYDDFARQEFNKKRTLIIRNTPVVTYAEVKAYMGRFAVADISISKRQQHAIVTLKNGSEAEAAVSELSGNRLAGLDVKISLYRADNLLYVTGLPDEIIRDDHEFRSFAEGYGPLEKCFLMRASDGHSKGYGIVEFAHNREKSEHAKCKINGIRLGLVSSVIHCGFVSDSITSFEELHSRCLKVSHFPLSVTNSALHAVFSKVAPPAYFEVTHCDNKGNRFALVEFLTGVDAENTVRELKTWNCALLVEYCAPGETPAEILRLIRTSPVSDPTSKHAVDVCPAVISMIENNSQALEYFHRVLHQLHENTMCQQTVSGTHGCGYTSQSDTMLLTNPSFQTALLVVLFAGQQHKQQALSGVGESMMLQAAAMIEKHCSPVHDVHNTRAPTNLLKNPLLAMVPFSSTILSSISGPPFVTDAKKPVLSFSNTIHPSPSVLVPQMPFTPQNSTLPPDVVVPFPTVPPPILHPSLLRSNSVVPLDTAKMLASSHPPPLLRPIIEPYPRSVPHLDGKLSMSQSSYLAINALPNTVPQSNVGLHQSACNRAPPQNVGPPNLLPNTVLPIIGVPPPPITTPLGSGPPPCVQSLPSALVSSDWLASGSSTSLHGSVNAILAPRSALPVVVNRVPLPQDSFAQVNGDVPAVVSAPTSPSSKRKMMRAIVGRRAHDQMSEKAAGQSRQENKPNNEAFTETLPMHSASTRPNTSRVLTESGTNIEKPAVLSVIGQKRSRLASTGKDGMQFPATPVRDHSIKSNFIQSPEPSPDSEYVGQHSQGIGGHYADSYFTKRRKLKD